MNNFLTEKNGIKYYAVVSHFWPNQTGYIKLNELKKQNFINEETFNKLSK